MFEQPVFFDSGAGLLRVVVTGTLGYAGVVFFLRASGKRTLSKLNMFDFIITVAFGSILAALMLSDSVALAEGLTAFAVLIALQFAVTWTSTRWRAFADLVKAEPRLLFRNGAFLSDAMRNERVSKEEVNAAIRAASIGDAALVAAVILETDGSLSVIPRASDGGLDLAPERKT